MDWRPEHINFASSAWLELVDHPDGAAHYGALTAMRNLAAHGKPRGTITGEDGRAMDATTIAKLTRLPEPLIEATIKRCIRLNYLKYSTRKSRVTSHLGSRDGAAMPRNSAEKPRLQERIGHNTTETEEEKDRSAAPPRQNIPDEFKQAIVNKCESGGIGLSGATPSFLESVVSIAFEAGVQPERAAELLCKFMRQPRVRSQDDRYVLGAFKSILAEQLAVAV
jgi:transposase-like protein